MQLVLALVAGTAILSTGCVGKKLFRTTVAEQDQKIQGVSTATEENEKRIGDLKEETRSEIARLDGKTSQALSMSSEASDRAAGAERLAKGTLLWEETLTNDQIRFDFNKATLQPNGQAALDDIASRIKSLNRQVYVEIQGHTDSTGDQLYNRDLGQRRAQAVAEYLHEHQGIPLHLIEAISYGEERPVAENTTAAGRASNRRVVIRVLDPTASLGTSVAGARAADAS